MAKRKRDKEENAAKAYSIEKKRHEQRNQFLSNRKNMELANNQYMAQKGRNSKMSLNQQKKDLNASF